MEKKKKGLIKGASFRVEGRESFLNFRPGETETPLKAPRIFTLGGNRGGGAGDILVTRGQRFRCGGCSLAFFCEKGLSRIQKFSEACVWNLLIKREELSRVSCTNRSSFKHTSS
ncbi:hypothetical protein EUGRSUZ_D00429 [Eucalyptus grandis]|uniref:Uncharacterized protein n=2 Tax=Eucalyptus grandis TaxID=71139 RepID=A0ACC3L2P7_EUCGR|nr:hypothetical protein EUGRSUZ_D00429 [Eucalyptus grandis]